MSIKLGSGQLRRVRCFQFSSFLAVQYLSRLKESTTLAQESPCIFFLHLYKSFTTKVMILRERRVLQSGRGLVVGGWWLRKDVED